MRWLVLLSVLLATPALAFERPPKECRGKPDPKSYVVHSVANPNKVCRTLGQMPPAGLFSWYGACTIPGLLNGKRPVALIIMPKRKGFGYARLLEHELGHVNCPEWRD